MVVHTSHWETKATELLQVQDQPEIYFVSTITKQHSAVRSPSSSLALSSVTYYPNTLSSHSLSLSFSEDGKDVQQSRALQTPSVPGESDPWCPS